jgi:hypothetical protein
MAPIQWLMDLESHRNGYRTLLEETGSLSSAAYRLAKAWCLVRPVSTKVPTRIEVEAAAKRIADRTGWRGHVPNASMLALDCEAEGLLVL